MEKKLKSKAKAATKKRVAAKAKKLAPKKPAKKVAKKVIKKAVKKPVKKVAKKTARKTPRMTAKVCRDPENYEVRKDIDKKDLEKHMDNAKSRTEVIRKQYKNTDPLQKGLTYGDPTTMDGAQFEDIILRYGSEDAVDRAIKNRDIKKLKTVTFLGVELDNINKTGCDKEVSSNFMHIKIPVSEIMKGHKFMTAINKRNAGSVRPGRRLAFLLIYVGSNSVFTIKGIVTQENKKQKKQTVSRISYVVDPESRVQCAECTIPLDSLNVVE